LYFFSLLLVEDKIDQFKGKYGFLNNFFHHEGRITAEHLFQSMKTTNPLWQLAILDAETPGEAKRLGRECPLREDWEEIKDDVMWCVLQIKFRRGSDCRKWLLETGNAELIEGNWHGDSYWGLDNKTQAGKNILGKLLMELREAIKEAE
jgi:ribA/ribD-fused uncharacterized protein